MIRKLFGKSSGVHLIVGFLWSVVAVWRYIENGFHIQADAAIFILAACLFYIFSIVVFITNKQKS